MFFPSLFAVTSVKGIGVEKSGSKKFGFSTVYTHI